MQKASDEINGINQSQRNRVTYTLAPITYKSAISGDI